LVAHLLLKDFPVSGLRIALSGTLVIVALSCLNAAGPRESDWKAVQDAIAGGLPKTAIDKLEPIIAEAMNEKQYAEAIKAICTKIALEGNIQGNQPDEKITRMREEISEVPAEMKPVMDAILANWFWHYFQQNRWRFMQRTQTAAVPGNDFTTWDLTRILAEIDKQFQVSLAPAETLQKIPVADYDELLEKGTAPDAYRPTLFDVLAYNALDFYSSGEQAASRVQDAFDLSAGSPIFSDADSFVAWTPDTTDGQSMTLKAIRVYQDLLRFHQRDTDHSAFLDADLQRLVYGYNTAFGEEKEARYKAALKRLADANASNVISARALHRLATVVHGEGDWVEARSIASEGLSRHGDSVGGRRCYNLIEQIEARSSRVTTERVWTAPRPTIDVHYRNVTKIYFRLVEFDFERFIQSQRGQPEQLDPNQRLQLLAREPIKAWSADLPNTEDYQERVERLSSPADLPKGSYYLIASHDPDFSDDDNQVSFTEIWVSTLAIVTRRHQGAERIDGLILDAEGGQPIADATVRVWQRDNRNRLSERPSAKTDRNGWFEIQGRDRRPLLILASHDGQSLSSSNYLRTYNIRPVEPREQTMFFTDRALYRPGQTIQFKGICMSINQTADDYKTIPNRKVTVFFSDVNGKQIERLELRTNDYGSFSGSVTAPRDRLMGRMRLTVPGGPRGSAMITVEEYKRPKFQVKLDSPEVAAKLGARVKLRGQATAYTGAAVNDAKVSWRVVRQVRYPVWWYWRCWWMQPQGGGSQEIAHGLSSTSASGAFDIEFVAAPDPSVSEESEPTFVYQVFADVTDTAGETRSTQRSVHVGYTALSATLSADNWLTDDKPTEITIQTTTLDDEGQSAAGRLTIYAVEQPESVTRQPLDGASGRSRSDVQPKADPSNPNSWPLGEAIDETDFETNAGGKTTVKTELAAGMYRAKLETKDRFGKAVTAELPLRVLDPDAKKLNLKLPNLFASPTTTVEPGEQFDALWGSGYDSARAYVEVEHRGKMLQSFWTAPGTTQVWIKQPVDETMRGGFTVRTTMVRENRAYTQDQHVNVPWTNKQLELQWQHFVSKLEPAAKETWTALIAGPDAERHAAEMVATLYDASLDAYQSHQWPGGFNVFRNDFSRVQTMFENQLKSLQTIVNSWNVPSKDGRLTYRHFPPAIIHGFYGYQALNSPRFRRGGAMLGGIESEYAPVPMAAATPMEADGAMMSRQMAAPASNLAADASVGEMKSAAGDGGVQPPAPDLSSVSARKNLNETAFFFPHLISGDDGTVKMEFTMPEALTEWKFMGFAHDQQLRGGLLSGTTVTAKDLMIQPNPPRFLREGDVVEFTVKVSNQSPTRQTGSARLSFSDARTNDSVDERLGNHDRDQAFDLAAGESIALAWRVSVPDGLGFLIYKAVGSTGRLSDGEEGFLPVLSKRILVTESLPLNIRGKQTKRFDFKKLLHSGESDSLESQSLTVQMVSNPSWYAVMALPYLMDYPHQCSEQTFNRFYANALARHIAGSDPRIHRVFQQWRSTPALDSPLAKNQDMKSVMIEETPWYQESESESQARRNVGLLFEDNRLNDEASRSLQQLTQMQFDDGAWPWFPGGQANDYITLYITTGFGRMRHLGVQVDITAALKSLKRLDEWATKQFEKIAPADRDKNHLSASLAFYLYGRSFFLADQAVAPEHSQAVDYWLSQAKTHWLALAHRQSQAHLAVALKRFDQIDAANQIMASIKERSVSDQELGMFWRDSELSWWWYRAPIETQAMMIEAFDEVMNDADAVEECKIWLLKQKQTQDWKTTKATADAVYALLLRGSNLLASDELVEVSLGGTTIQAKKVEAGTGFFEQRFLRGEIQPAFGEIVVKKLDDGVAWGGVHWQYLEDMSNVTPHDETPLSLTKQLYIKKNTAAGPTLVAVDGPLEVGDELIVRVVLRSDRDMEYVHLKDYRGSGTEPVNVLSRYKYQDGLAYYESTRDTASHFFIDYLPKGSYVFEYATRVQLRGDYQTGVASIECMYAPEFNSHSASLPIEVR
jgi:uncharacterized protein YfaS (alpha-2-macroglobulin family)